MGHKLSLKQRVLRAHLCRKPVLSNAAYEEEFSMLWTAIVVFATMMGAGLIPHEIAEPVMKFKKVVMAAQV